MGYILFGAPRRYGPASAPCWDDDPMTDAERPHGLAMPTRVLLTLAAAAVAVAGMWAARELIGPIVLAVVLVIIAHPVRAMLEKRAWPRWAATTPRAT